MSSCLGDPLHTLAESRWESVLASGLGIIPFRSLPGSLLQPWPAVWVSSMTKTDQNLLENDSVHFLKKLDCGVRKGHLKLG